MSWWKRRAVTREDDVFGRLVRDRDGWTVEASASDPPLISVISGDDGPADAQRSAHLQLQEQLNDLADDLAEALYKLYRPQLNVPGWEGPRPTSASALRDMLELSSITYMNDGTPELLFGFKGDIWPDAMFTVEIRDGKVRGIALDD